MGEKEQLDRFPSNKCGRNKGNNKSPLEPHSSNCSREDAPENVKVNKQEKKIFSSKFLPRYLLIIKGKIVTS